MTLDPTCSHPLPSHQEGPAQPLALCARMGVHATSTTDGCGCDVSATRALKPHYACTMRALRAITMSTLPLKHRLSNLRSTVTGRAGVSSHMEHKESCVIDSKLGANLYGRQRCPWMCPTRRTNGRRSKKIVVAAAHDGHQRSRRECSSTRRTRSVRVETHRSHTRKTPCCTTL